MSGHSKWSTIKHKKGAADAKRGKIFSRITKEVQIAVKEGGPDADSNSRLRVAIQNAKSVNMPKDNILRAIKKASEEGGGNLQEVTFEGYGPGGVAVFVECTTDNNNRTVGSIRHIFSKRGGDLGTNGSLSFIFDRKGIIEILKTDDIDIEEFELELIDAGAEDFEIEDDLIIITTALEDFSTVQKKIEEMSVEIQNAGLHRIPNLYKLLPVEDAKKLLNLIDYFEDDEDVQNVYHNLEMTDELATALEE